MTRPKTMAEAERLALEGNGESQDSQAILEAVKAEIGAGTTSSSPVHGQVDGQSLYASSRHHLGAVTAPNPAGQAASVQGDTISALDETEVVQFADEEQIPPHDRDTVQDGPADDTDAVRFDFEQLPDTAAAIIKSSQPHDEDEGAHSVNNVEYLPGLPPKKMEASQQTPTQVNDGRDYNEFCDHIPPSPVDNTNNVHSIDDTTQMTNNEPRTLQEDDTGAVNFGNLSQLARPSSQISEDGGFENTKSEWRIPEQTPRQHSASGYTPFKPQSAAPETPALPKNPFGARPNIGGAPFAGTQLFGQTQFSSAVKVSPTSSRPSPNLFLNSISPNLMETSPLKNRANVSSPTDIRTSSPARLHEVPATVIKGRNLSAIQEDTPTHATSRDDLIPESPTYHAPKSSLSRQPMAHYEPMKQSQERKAGTDIPPLNLGYDSDSDDAIHKLERKKRIERKRALAAQEMSKVSFPRVPRRNSDEPPNKRRRRTMNDASEYVAQFNGEGESDQAKVQDSVSKLQSSQRGIVASAETVTDLSTKATPGEDGIRENSHAELPSAKIAASGTSMEEEMIPATSPVRSSPAVRQALPSTSDMELPVLTEHTEENEDCDNKDEDPSSLPPIRARARQTYRKTARHTKRNPFISSSAPEALPTNNEVHVEHYVPTMKSPASSVSPVEEEKNNSASDVVNGGDAGDQINGESLPPTSAPGTVELPATRSRRSAKASTTPLTPRVVDLASSSLTAYTSTPVPSAITTPGTQESLSCERLAATHTILPSSETGRGLRKRTSRAAAKSESPRPSRVIKQVARLGSSSTDELQQSPSITPLGRSMNSTKSGRAFRQSLQANQKPRKLFEGMAFAISLQSDKSAGKPQPRSELVRKIQGAGGVILEEGFQDLFEPFAIMDTSHPVFDEPGSLQVVQSRADCGFTALIADGHSRKAKYMQALALGLPCLAHQWITACLQKGDIVDWQPYLLCAGSSAVLGDAIRSRSLEQYDAADVRLDKVVEQRPKLLDGQQMLVVVDSKKARSQTKRQYMFLAQAMGPSISRVSTVQQAREALLEHQKSGNPFSWLYIDKSAGTAESVLSAPEPGGKKRKRVSSASTATTANIRVLNDELVIQSLILGRMVEEDEVNF